MYRDMKPFLIVNLYNSKARIFVKYFKNGSHLNKREKYLAHNK